MRRFLEITIPADERGRELLLPGMEELGCYGFQETETALLCYMVDPGWDEQAREALLKKTQLLAGSMGIVASATVREIVEEDWNAEWEKSLRPIEIGNHILVVPSTSEEIVNPAGRLVIRITPKMSFGTGYHETTRLTLRLLEKHLRPGSSMLDVGTGTGILAIAAVRLGAATALGIDIDEWAIDNANENIRSNGLDGRVVISSDPLERIAGTSFDLIAANLTLNIILANLGEFYRILPPSGIVLLSGVLLPDRDTLFRSLREASFEPIDELTENQWLAAAARRMP